MIIHPRIISAKFDWNWPRASEEYFLKSSIYVFTLFRDYLPLEKGGALHLNKFESPSPKDALCQVWLKLAQWFRRRFLNFVNVKLDFIQGWFVLSLAEIGPVIQ